MPELPEVETIVRDLRGRLPGHSFTSTRVLRRDVVPTPPRQLSRGLIGRRIVAVERRAKAIVIELDSPDVLIVRLGMTGTLLYAAEGARPPSTHPAVRFGLDRSARLVYDDVRRFGSVELLSARLWQERQRGFGPEPLARGYRAEHLLAGLRSSSTPVRSWLLDQRRIAGVGNIYANEALYLARIHPSRPARSVTETEAHDLHAALRDVLRAAIRSRGTTLRDYRDAGGEEGAFGGSLHVYGREGFPCDACSSAIERSVFGGRSAYHCPVCQPRP